MTSKERIKNILAKKPFDRIGIDFNAPHLSDFFKVKAAKLLPANINPDFFTFGKHEEILAKVPWFKGEVRYDPFGNIMGRLDDFTKGECIKGSLDDWDDLKNFEIPDFDRKYPEKIKELAKDTDKFVLASCPYGIFSLLRDTRLFENALADIVCEEDNVKLFLEKAVGRLAEIFVSLKDSGVDGIMTGDDWGIQDRTFISPDSFASVFKPYYKKLFDAAHDCGFSIFMHSCGYNYKFIPHLLEAGLDVFQYDQPSVYPEEVLAKEFGDKTVFYLPVDIQKIMPTGDEKIIREGAKHMVEVFKTMGGGALIAKDYPTWQDIAVKEEWADYARDEILKHAYL